MQGITATVQQVVQLTATAATRLKTYLQVYSDLAIQRAEVDEAMDDAKAQVEAIRESTGLDKLGLDGYTITRVNGAKRLKLNETKLKKLLIANGLDLDLIDQCYEETVSKAYTKITANEG